MLYTLSFYLFLIKTEFNAVIKYYANSFPELSILNYIPIAIITICVYIEFFKGRYKKSFIITLIFFIYTTIISLLNVKTFIFPQIIYGIYLASPIFIGIMVYKHIVHSKYMNIYFFIILLTINFSGIMLDLTYNLPWNDFSIDFFGSLKTINTDNIYFGITRPGGFTGKHWTAGSIAMLSFIYVSNYCINKYLIIYNFIITFIVLLLLYVKSLIVIYIILTSIYLARNFLTKNKIRLISNVFFFLFILITLSIIFLKVSDNLSPTSKFDMFTHSFFTRYVLLKDLIYNKIMSNLFYAVCGMGFGSVGGASIEYSKFYPSSADNLLLYFWSLGGIAGISFVMFNYIKIIQNINLSTSTNHTFFMLFLLIYSLCYGCVVNFIEFGINGAVFGILIAHAYRKSDNFCYTEK
jgi:hypothetical protein